jgi:hypothetical protein
MWVALAIMAIGTAAWFAVIRWLARRRQARLMAALSDWQAALAEQEAIVDQMATEVGDGNRRMAERLSSLEAAEHSPPAAGRQTEMFINEVLTSADVPGTPFEVSWNRKPTFLQVYEAQPYFLLQVYAEREAVFRGATFPELGPDVYETPAGGVESLLAPVRFYRFARHFFDVDLAANTLDFVHLWGYGAGILIHFPGHGRSVERALELWEDAKSGSVPRSDPLALT